VKANVSGHGKAAAATYAAGLVEDGMVVGLGTGSTASLFVQALGVRVRGGLSIVGVPTSVATAQLAEKEGIATATLEEQPSIDLDVDGADAVDPQFALLKGLGGALLREKIVAASSTRFVVVVDEAKMVETLTGAGLVPVEVVTFGWSRTFAALQNLGATAMRRTQTTDPAQPYMTDGGNYLFDCAFPDLSNAAVIGAAIKALTGVVDHGLFIGMTSAVVVGMDDGTVRVVAHDHKDAPGGVR